MKGLSDILKGFREHDAMRADMAAATPVAYVQSPNRETMIALHLLLLDRWRAKDIAAALDGVIADLMKQHRLNARPARRSRARKSCAAEVRA